MRVDTTPRPAPDRVRADRIRDDAQVASFKRLGRMVQTDPHAAKVLRDKGAIVSVATSTAVKTAVSVSVGIGCGWSSGNCFWDPFNRGWNHCGPFWNWWCSPGWSWWWSSCCCPWWGSGWGFSYWSGNYGFWYGGWPGNCGYPVAYYAPYPAYYSTVIYDTYSPPPVRETVYVEQPASSYVEGEGAIQVGSPSDTTRPVAKDGRGSSLQAAASHHLTLGDQAFREGRYSDAVHDYAKAVEMAPEEGVLHLILSDALFATGDYHYAAFALRRALELDPTLAESVVDKHSFYTDPSEFDRQLELLERYLEDHFLDDDARLLLGANYVFGGRPAQAADLFQSPFSVAVRESAAGNVLLQRALKLREQKILEGKAGN